jgi:hypothetical protein
MNARTPVGMDRAVVSHDSALVLHGLSDVLPNTVHLLVSREDRGVRPPSGVTCTPPPRPSPTATSRLATASASRLRRGRSSTRHAQEPPRSRSKWPSAKPSKKAAPRRTNSPNTLNETADTSQRSLSTRPRKSGEETLEGDALSYSCHGQATADTADRVMIKGLSRLGGCDGREVGLLECDEAAGEL